jgi:hypothetical protein
MTAACSMSAMRCRRPPHRGHASTSNRPLGAGRLGVHRHELGPGTHAGAVHLDPTYQALGPARSIQTAAIRRDRARGRRRRRGPSHGRPPACCAGTSRGPRTELDGSRGDPRRGPPTPPPTTPLIALMTWICTGGTPICSIRWRSAIAAGLSSVMGNPKASSAASKRSALSSAGRTRMSRSPVNRGAPWKASAYAPTTTNSTPWAIKDPMNSSKSGASSIDLPAKVLDGRKAFSGCA